MSKRMIAASIAAMMLIALVPASMAQSSNVSSDIQPYNGLVGANSPVYSFKLLYEQLDLLITLDSHEKLKKQIAYADERLAEARAMADANDSSAVDAALSHYESQMDAINASTYNGSDAIDVDDHLDEHEKCLEDLMNDTNMSENNMERLIDLYNHNIDIKYGRPFLYYNNTTTGNITRYFAPPGQLKKINSTNMPPGLAKKGYMKPVPTITNGSPAWPWDQIQYQFKNNTMPKVTFDPKNNHGNGNGNGKSNGNGNGHNK